MKQKPWQCACCMLLLASGATAQNARITWGTFDIGFGASRMSNTMLTSLTGESCIGAAREGNTMLAAGFLGNPSLWQTIMSVPAHSPMPMAYALYQNYPNPFNPSTTIKYELPRTSYVTLSVFDMLGREVSVLVNEGIDAGYHEVRFAAAGVASGVYYYRLQAGNFVSTKKMLILK